MLKLKERYFEDGVTTNHYPGKYTTVFDAGDKKTYVKPKLTL